MNGHTPGPWWFGIQRWDCDSAEPRDQVKTAEYSGNGYSDNPFIRGADGTTIVGCDEYDVFGDFSGDHRKVRREADIRLMLAAPELLEALIVMEGKAGKQNWNDKYPDELQAARAAIAKATGAQP